jgi:hypothetical protein
MMSSSFGIQTFWPGGRRWWNASSAVWFNERDGNCAEKDVAWAVGSGYAEGARVEDGGERVAA